MTVKCLVFFAVFISISPRLLLLYEAYRLTQFVPPRSLVAQIVHCLPRSCVLCTPTSLTRACLCRHLGRSLLCSPFRTVSQLGQRKKENEDQLGCRNEALDQPWHQVLGVCTLDDLGSRKVGSNSHPQAPLSLPALLLITVAQALKLSILCLA